MRRARGCIDAAVRAGPRASTTGRPARSSSSTTPTASEFYFLEVNTRLQVEHGVTEAVTGIDLVEWMVRQAAGDRCTGCDWVRWHRTGAAIEVRVYAEDPAQNFRPSAGLLTDVFTFRPMRVSTPGSRPAPRSRRYYDPLLAKVIVHGATRAQARSRSS